MTICICIDIDWAPDWQIEFVLNLLDQNDVRATWFLTHPTPMLDRIRASPRNHELAIHPYFAPESDQGSTPKEVLAFLLALVPEARCTRSHRAILDGPARRAIGQETRLTVEATWFEPVAKRSQIKRTTIHGRELHRISAVWADDAALTGVCAPWTGAQSTASRPGPQVVTFHPVHVANDHATLEDYNATRHRTDPGSQERPTTARGALLAFEDVLAAAQSDHATMMELVQRA